MGRKDTTENGKNPTTVKKTPAQKEKEEKESRLNALSLIVQEKTREIENLEKAAEMVELPDIAGKGVIHVKFGQGEIVSCKGRVFRIEFSNGKKIRMKFPDAFDKELLKPGSEEDVELFESICSTFRPFDEKKDGLSKKIYELSLEKSRINL